jgi:hypothetical protein
MCQQHAAVSSAFQVSVLPCSNMMFSMLILPGQSHQTDGQPELAWRKFANAQLQTPQLTPIH